MVKSLPAKAGTSEMWVSSLGSENSLQKGVAIHSSILAWRIPWTEEPGGLQPMVRQSWTQLKHIHILNCTIKSHILWASYIIFLMHLKIDV